MDFNENVYKKAALILKHLRGETTPREASALEQWMNERDENRRFIESLENDKALTEEFEFFSTLDVSSAWKNIEQQTIKRRPGYQVSPLRYAAVILLLLVSGGALFTLMKRQEATDPVAQATENLHHDIPPGSDRAVLELADGSTIMLEQAEDGALKSENGIRINKQDNALIYDAAGKAENSGVTYNKVSTPRGGQFNVILPDGTKVWLNAQSTLRYPTSFAGNERRVEMTGEAYFEVSQDAQRPFEVAVGTMTINVLGTHFNVMAYANEPSMNTTLLEGSVRISKHGLSKTIVPGQQARVTDSIALYDADPEEAIAWKKGFFQFSNTSLDNILRQLERWYVADITYDQMPSLHFTGSISRDNNISQVLNMLALTGGIQFEIGPDRKVILSTEVGKAE